MFSSFSLAVCKKDININQIRNVTIYVFSAIIFKAMYCLFGILSIDMCQHCISCCTKSSWATMKLIYFRYVPDDRKRSISKTNN